MAELTSENAYLAYISKHFPNQHPHMLKGRGDDCVEISCPSRMSLSKDLFIEDVHFRQTYFSAGDIGYKALAVNVSDLASAGAIPLGFSMGLMTPSGLDETFWDELFEGMAELANEHNIALTGGDLSKAAILGLSVTVWGGPVDDLPFLERSNCAPGDAIFAIGELGLARTGLLALEEMGLDAKALYPHATTAHLRPTPRVQEGKALARMGDVCLMDLSDGLARDLPRLLGADKGTSLGANLELSENILHGEVISYAMANGEDAVEQAFLGGEDYALIGTCAANRISELKEHVPHAQIIGEVIDNEGLSLNGLPWEGIGFDHFAK